MNVTAVLAIMLALVAYGLISRKIEGSILTGPILFSAFGLIAGPAVFGLIPLQISKEALHLLAEVFHGNGFIAAFVAGLAFGNTLKHKCRFVYEFAESEGQILILLTFTAFGAVMIPQAMGAIDLKHILFGALVLTVLRMLPVHLSLLGTGIKPITSAFLGWFGPRGLASILFVLLILDEAELAHESTLFAIVIITVALSVALHGISAGPAARWFGAKSQRMGECEENRPVSDEPFTGPAR